MSATLFAVEEMNLRFGEGYYQNTPYIPLSKFIFESLPNRCGLEARMFSVWFEESADPGRRGLRGAGQAQQLPRQPRQQVQYVQEVLPNFI